MIQVLSPNGTLKQMQDFFEKNDPNGLVRVPCRSPTADRFEDIPAFEYFIKHVYPCIGNEVEVQALEAKCELLIEKGFNMDVKDPRNSSLLQLAVAYQNHIMQDFLIKQGLDPNLKNIWGSTSLLEAIFLGDETSVEKLLKAGADMNAIDATGHTALHYASMVPENIEGFDSCKIQCVKKLVEAGADLNIQDREGNTALHYLVDNQAFDFEWTEEFGHLFLKQRIDLHLRNKKGVSVLEDLENLLTLKTQREWIEKVKALSEKDELIRAVNEAQVNLSLASESMNGVTASSDVALERRRARSL